MNTEQRVAAERTIITRLVRTLLKAGYCVGYHDGEELAVRPGASTYSEISDNLHSTDEGRLVIRRADDLTIRWGVLLVYGNDPWEVFATWTAAEALDSLIWPIIDAAEARYA